MPIQSAKRKLVGPGPWEREPKPVSYPADELESLLKYDLKRPKFGRYNDNIQLDIYTKRAALVVAPSVVGLTSYLGEEEIFQCSGTIIESNGDSSIILTSADVIRYQPNITFVPDNIKIVVHLSDSRLIEGQIMVFDYHYNIAAIKIQSDAPLPIARLTQLNDSITVDSSNLDIPEEKSFQLRPHSDSYKLIPGDRVIALGRYFVKPHHVMAAPGEFSVGRCFGECKELLRANCNITICGIGGPLINRYGEVIGICFYDGSYTPFLPINLVSTWWNHWKKNGELRRPYLGMEVTNLYAAGLYVIERTIQKFPNIFKGVIVEDVIPGSCADSAGINQNDVIIKFGGKDIQGFLELFEVMWDNVGNSVDLVVLRASGGGGVPLHLSMVVEEATPDRFYSWPFWRDV